MSLWTANDSARTRSATTTSSSAALPARSPMPLIVHSIWVAGGNPRERVRDREAEIVVAMHRELHMIELRAHRADLREQAREPIGQHVADSVGNIDDVGARRDRGPADLGEERRIRASRVLGRELHLVGALARVRHRPVDALEHLLGRQSELSLHMKRKLGLTPEQVLEGVDW